MSLATKTSALDRTFRRSFDAAMAVTASWPGNGLLLAISGGSDSVGLLHLLVPAARELGLPITLAHLDHGLRGAEARSDQHFVVELARRLELPCIVEAVDTRAYAEHGHLSIEDAAHRLRRTFLKRVAVERKCRCVVLGHTLDDQAETLLLHLLRGAGPRGLSAMQPVGPRPFLRPLLGIERETIQAWLTAQGHEWREDSSNMDSAFTRNRVRHELMPLLKGRFNPQAPKALVRAAGLQHEIDQLLRKLAAAHLERSARIDEVAGRVVLDRRALIAEPLALQRVILRTAGERIVPARLSWGQVHLEGVLGGLIQRGEARWVFPSGMVLVRSGDELTLERQRGPDHVDPPHPDPIEVPVESGLEVAWGGGHLRLTIFPADGTDRGALRPDPGQRALLADADRLGPRLILRAARVGERMTLFGGGHHRKLSDILIDARVALSARRFVPVLAEPTPDPSGAPADEAFWLIGVARSAAATVTESTHRVLLLEWFGPLAGVGRKVLHGH